MSPAQQAVVPLRGEDFYESIAVLADEYRAGNSVDLVLKDLPNLEVTITFDTNKRGECARDRTNIGAVMARVVVPRREASEDWARMNGRWIRRFLSEVETGYGKLDAATVLHYNLVQAIYAPTQIFGVNTYSRPILMQLSYNSYHTQVNWGRIRPLLKSPQLSVRGTTFFDLPGLEASMNESFARGGGVVIWRDHMVPVEHLLNVCANALERGSEPLKQLYPTLELETFDGTIFSYATKEDLYPVGEGEPVVGLRARVGLRRGAITDSRKYILPAHVALVGEWIYEQSGKDSLSLEVAVGTSYTTVKDQVTTAR